MLAIFLFIKSVLFPSFTFKSSKSDLKSFNFVYFAMYLKIHISRDGSGLNKIQKFITEIQNTIDDILLFIFKI